MLLPLTSLENITRCPGGGPGRKCTAVRPMRCAQLQPFTPMFQILWSHLPEEKRGCLTFLALGSNSVCEMNNSYIGSLVGGLTQSPGALRQRGPA